MGVFQISIGASIKIISAFFEYIYSEKLENLQANGNCLICFSQIIAGKNMSLLLSAPSLYDVMSQSELKTTWFQNVKQLTWWLLQPRHQLVNCFWFKIHFYIVGLKLSIFKKLLSIEQMQLLVKKIKLESKKQLKNWKR